MSGYTGVRPELEEGKTRHVAYYAGQRIASQSTEWLAKKSLQSHTEALANAASSNSGVAIEKLPEFSINARFDFLTQAVEMVAQKKIASALVTGEGGLGKTYTVNKTLASLGMSPFDQTADVIEEEGDEDAEEDDDVQVKTPCPDNQYVVVKGYSTARALFDTLKQYCSNIIIFDDCDSVFKDKNGVNILKGALDSYDKRFVSWNTSTGTDIFEFTGSIIFISNLSRSSIDQAIRTRAFCVDLEMTTDQKIERMEVIAKNPEFMPDIQISVKMEALALLKNKRNVAHNMSMRTLIQVAKVATGGGKWQEFATYLVTNGD